METFAFKVMLEIKRWIDILEKSSDDNICIIGLKMEIFIFFYKYCTFYFKGNIWMLLFYTTGVIDVNRNSIFFSFTENKFVSKCISPPIFFPLYGIIF